MTVDAFIAAHLNVSPPSDIELFDMFNVDMTESYYKRWNADGRVERVRVMERISGQKKSERMLWSVRDTAPETIAEIEKRERAEVHAHIDAAYAANPDYELDVDDVMGFATALAKAGLIHPSHLLGDDGELD